jgi:chemotaxis protein methyltransferase CheR
MVLSILQDNLILTDQEFEQISELVYDHCGIDLHDGKKELVRSRLAKLVRKHNVSSFEEYRNRVLSDVSDTMMTELTDAISTNLTSFFREPQHFSFLSERLIPELIRRKDRHSSKIRCWSAGCSTGEEPYTIAITLLESMRTDLQWDMKILATDISSRVLDWARHGLYDEQRVAPVPAAAKNRYLTAHRQQGRAQYQVNPLLQKMVVFKYLNLMEPWPFKGPMDFIFCRNVMIYFDKPTQQKLVSRYWDVLDHGGYLFTGHSESLTGISHKFRYIQPTIYRKD